MVRYALKGRQGRIAVLVAVAVAVLVAAIGAGADVAAAQESPRWVIKTVTTPTNIDVNTPRNEVQRLKVEATAGTFTLALSVRTRGLERTTALPYDATAAEVQAALAGLEGMGAGSASVSGGPATTNPHEYQVALEGVEGDAPVEEMEVDSSGLEGGHASVTETTRGVTTPQVVVTATNVGGVATDGSRITVGDILPSWLRATKVFGFDAYAAGFEDSGLAAFGGVMNCAAPPAISCTYGGRVDPGDQLLIFAEVKAGAAPPPGAANRASVQGGNAPEATVEVPLGPNSAPAQFGPEPGSVFAAASSTQAGAHPNVVTSFWLNTQETDGTAGNPKDIRFDLPPGLVGSTVGLPRCDMQRVIEATGGGGDEPCPSDTMVGLAEVTIGARDGGSPETLTTIAPVYNIAPSPGEPAAFAFDVIALPVRLDTTVLSDGNYGVRVTAPDISEVEQVIASTVTIWGVPSEHSGPGSNGEAMLARPFTYGGPDPGQSPVPLLTNPQQCSEPLVATMSTDGWAQPGMFHSETASMGKLTGCGVVPFSSSFTFLPDTLEAGAPAGYAFDLSVPQHNQQNTLASSSLKDFKLELPEGVVVNPSAAWGLKACSNAQFYGPSHPSQEPASPAACPREAQVGEVEVETPDLEHPLKGQVFLGTPECDPCTPVDAEEGKMVRLFVQLIGTGEAGIVVKLEGHGLIDQKTGRITTEFHGTPQVPFNHLHFVLEGGPRAVLANPRTCGTVKATGELTPWNSLLAPGEEGLVSDSRPFYEFEINQNCFAPQFAPSFKAGMPNIQAGAYGEFTLAFGRSDNDEFLGQITTSMPVGLLGKIAGIPLCKEAQAVAGTCDAASQIGTVEALTGPGANPFLVSGGHVYLTEGYGGAPYGLSIVVPAVAGPYTLSGTNGAGSVVVRAQIFVNEHTAQLTVVSGQLPSMLDGIPLQLKAVNVRIDRPFFTFNPTNCGKTAIAARIGAVEGMSANLASPFQVTNCASLAFKPEFHVSTAGRTSRANGASLDVKLSYPQDAFGKYANIAKVKVDLPKRLPSRLTTLQKACPDSIFDANPAACPAASRVGSASATTPILADALSGPAYFVSHGGAKFPELVIVLSGDGVTVQLDGETFISKAGITSSTFRSVPDVPVRTFELKLPQGSNSALAANGSLCGARLKMPTAFTAQNGIVIRQSTSIAVTGCPKHGALSGAQQLAKALRTCKKAHSKAGRAKCEQVVRKNHKKKSNEK